MNVNAHKTPASQPKGQDNKFWMH